MSNVFQKVVAAVRGADVPLDPYAKLTCEIVEASGSEGLATAAEKSALKGYQGQWDKADEVMRANNDQAARVQWSAHQEDLRASVQSGKISGMDGWTRKDFEEDCRQKMEAAKAEKHRITMLSGQLVETISERFAKVAETFASEYAEIEAAQYSRFGVPYPGESQLVITLRRAAALARLRVPRGEYANASPRSMVPYVF